jgi:preprotein translocase subunit SecE
VTETSTTDTAGSGRARRNVRQQGTPVSRFFKAIALFISQILDELRKVVRPTRHELVVYTSVVIFFVSVVMAFVWGLDQAFVRLIRFAFGK